MSDTVRSINAFFRTAVRPEVEDVRGRLLLSDRQDRVFEMFYIRKMDIGYIADTLGVSPDTVNKDLQRIRRKMIRAMDI